MNATAYKRVPGITTIAEESTSWPGVTRATSAGGLGFGFKWNMGWMHDTLSYLRNDPVHRAYHHGEMTFGLSYAWSENYVLPLSHDEVVHGKGSLLRKMPGDRWQQLATLRAYLAFMWAHPGKQLVFMGAEIAQESEWAESRELDWWLLDHPEHRGMQSVVRDLNARYRDTPALWQLDHQAEGFQWLVGDDAANNVFAFARLAESRGVLAEAAAKVAGKVTGKAASKAASKVIGKHRTGDRPLVCVTNFSPVPRHDYVIGLPSAGVWEEVLNTDAEAYGGSGVGNLGSITATDAPSHGQPASAAITIPPLATVWFRPAED
jgi:1,4-alpha-glucan branching enzyme